MAHHDNFDGRTSIEDGTGNGQGQREGIGDGTAGRGGLERGEHGNAGTKDRLLGREDLNAK
jgi:hypothetical protein